MDHTRPHKTSPTLDELLRDLDDFFSEPAKCAHENTTCGPDRCFFGSVAVEPYTSTWRPAHGGTRHSETCLDCGASRHVNQNGQHAEYSPWSPASV